jgi:hypothetical protein
MKNFNRFAIAIGIALSQAGFAAHAAATFVAANGVDSATCGASATPCRTIAQAIDNTAAGGAVAVRPGVYGDVDANGQLDGNGEEPGTAQAVILIVKPIRLYSTAGADLTIIRGGYSRNAVLEISGDNVTLGGREAGFTVTGGIQRGVSAAGNQVAVIGNVAIRNAGTGFDLTSTGVLTATENSASDNDLQGYFLRSFTTGYVAFRKNRSISNGSAGVRVLGVDARHQIVGNVISAEDHGIELGQSPSRIYGNRLVGNNIGITIEMGPPYSTMAATIVRNDIIGSNAGGIGYFVFDGLIPGVTIRENNLFGGSVSIEYNVGCGLINNTSYQVDMRNNYWGAASGPGPKPADAPCNGPALTTPFATGPFDIPTY